MSFHIKRVQSVEFEVNKIPLTLSVVEAQALVKALGTEVGLKVTADLDGFEDFFRQRPPATFVVGQHNGADQ